MGHPSTTYCTPAMTPSGLLLADLITEVVADLHTIKRFYRSPVSNPAFERQGN